MKSNQEISSEIIKYISNKEESKEILANKFSQCITKMNENECQLDGNRYVRQVEDVHGNWRLELFGKDTADNLVILSIVGLGMKVCCLYSPMPNLLLMLHSDNQLDFWRLTPNNQFEAISCINFPMAGLFSVCLRKFKDIRKISSHELIILFDDLTMVKSYIYKVNFSSQKIINKTTIPDHVSLRSVIPELQVLILDGGKKNYILNKEFEVVSLSLPPLFYKEQEFHRLVCILQEGNLLVESADEKAMAIVEFDPVKNCFNLINSLISSSVRHTFPGNYPMELIELIIEYVGKDIQFTKQHSSFFKHTLEAHPDPYHEHKCLIM